GAVHDGRDVQAPGHGPVRLPEGDATRGVRVGRTASGRAIGRVATGSVAAAPRQGFNPWTRGGWVNSRMPTQPTRPPAEPRRLAGPLPLRSIRWQPDLPGPDPKAQLYFTRLELAHLRRSGS